LAAADLPGGGSRPLLVRSTPIPQKVVGREAPGLSGVKEEGVALDARRSTIPPEIEHRLFPGEGG
jgi:hypothetical protein